MSVQSHWVLPHLANQPFLEKPPLSYWMSAASMRLFGPSIAAARAPNLLYAAVTALAMGALGFAMDGVAAAIVAALVASTAITAFRVTMWLAPDACLLAGCARLTPRRLSRLHGRPGPQEALRVPSDARRRGRRLHGEECAGLAGPGRWRCSRSSPGSGAGRSSGGRSSTPASSCRRSSSARGSWPLRTRPTAPNRSASSSGTTWPGASPTLRPRPRISTARAIATRRGSTSSSCPSTCCRGPRSRPWPSGMRGDRLRLRDPRGTAWRFAVAASLPFLLLLSLAATARDVYAAPALLGVSLLIALEVGEAQRLGQVGASRDSCSGRAGWLPRSRASSPRRSSCLASPALTPTARLPGLIAAARILWRRSDRAGAGVAWLCAGRSDSQRHGQVLRGFQWTYAAYAAAFCITSLVLFPTIDRWQDLPLLARADSSRYRACEARPAQSRRDHHRHARSPARAPRSPS